MTALAEKPWCYDTMLNSCRKAWDEHDKTCTSLPHLWLGRKGGVSCPSDLDDCDGCGVTFFHEGLTCTDYDADDLEYLCDCCRRAGRCLLVADSFTRTEPVA